MTQPEIRAHFIAFLQTGRLQKLFKKLIFILSFAGMMMFFSADIDGVSVGDNRWEMGRQDSETYIVSRINRSLEKGIFSEVGTIPGYYSKPAAHVFIAGAFAKIITPLTDKPLPLLRWFTLFLFTLTVFLFLSWLYREFGWFPATVTYLLTFTMPWVYIFAWNTWWTLWFLLLPFVAVLLFLEKIEKKNEMNMTGLYLLIFSLFFLRSLCDYDFLSTVLVSMELPLIYYALKNHWSGKIWFIRSVLAGMAGIIGFIGGILCHVLQLALLFGSLPEALRFLEYTIGRRTGAFSVLLDFAFADSFLPSIQNVIWSYLVRDVSYRPPVLLGFPALPWIAGLFICLIFLAASREYFPLLAESRRKLFALTTITLISVSGVFSWLILAKGHAVIHHHIDYLLWSLPFTFLVSAVAGAFLSCLGQDLFLWGKCLSRWIWSDSKRKGVLALLILFCTVVLFTFYKINRSGAEKMIPLVIQNGKPLPAASTSKAMWFSLEGRIFIVMEKYAETNFCFIHLYPKKLKLIPKDKQQAGVVLFNFRFEDYELPSVFYSRYRIAMIKPPAGFTPVSVHYGEFSPSKKKLWERLETL